MWEAIISFFLTSVLSVFAKKTEFLDRPDSRKSHGRAVPPVGGVSIFLTLLIFERDNPFFLFSIPLFLLGLLDDLFDLSYRIKLAVTALVAVWFSTAVTIEVSIFGARIHPVFFVIWFVGMVNAFNVVDGLDGLLSGISLFSSLMIGERSLAFSIIGFLPWNLPDAKVFLGNSGSFLLGAYLSTASVVFFEGDLGYATLFLGFPFYEIVFSFVRRLVVKKNPFSPDEKHTHHVFSRKIGKWKTLLILVSFSLMFNLLGLSQKFYFIFLYVVLCCVLLFTYCVLQRGNGNLKL
ncbi:UDP-phosphate alpha-N-acetylglucosaminyl 1-phosphate transferase [Thermotoga maritima MSB8]|uniref:Undecaprenyl-phosphate alpha-N-acetylglucosaminyl 1-phosphate transferase n=1 Tax=Thermotoga maritima (strain ATCC 43589 / DSM 3109 / JCM 10099 / NBRC 100826 / MSB8) TaxID=243274 RepID=WECA_THEMA|nr:glycosyltransferase family 4 protein [Thermotoga maritima]Q9X1N5.1 RecName: Full=Undecaprenyl-phosphate alpha-N-acetylglucosaminyl 1-phosphate transferase; AltName: Full=UDP-GlcNAc:undecaprenyl-phosphate GlcNAc-1-phosphate transferase; AltName: Full=Undecaprenyl-phosphate GlcNAc-1-phosphate transferase [Thermotoga maritima MSB8]AAD36631.1 methicillin resistance protein [Thermotoga maritima MSB8]AGL50481.1 methicillin resistance protein [Thermotoga maritima MSB8]AHD19179.1 UDP-phosphate alpha